MEEKISKILVVISVISKGKFFRLSRESYECSLGLSAAGDGGFANEGAVIFQKIQCCEFLLWDLREKSNGLYEEIYKNINDNGSTIGIPSRGKAEGWSSIAEAILKYG